jgi:hypothetical protein
MDRKARVSYIYDCLLLVTTASFQKTGSCTRWQLYTLAVIRSTKRKIMKKRFTFLLLFVFINTLLFAQIEQELFDLPAVSFKKIKTPDGFQSAYELRIKQAIDHRHPEKGYFYQKAFLSHKGINLPTIIVTEGYARKSNYISEPAALIEANQIIVEHRFFGDSKPDSLDWQYLNLKQVTADYHHIRQLFGQIYSKKWLSTGVSKGGQTTIFYRYFYPTDVTVSMPYVAPMNLEFEEKRIYNFLDKVGTPACRKSIKQVQMQLFEQKEAALPLLKWFAKGKNLQFKYMSLEAAYEYAVLEYPFSFWQWGHDCADLPDTNASLDELLESLINISGLFLYSDAGIATYGAHYYQAATEMGYYGFETAPYKKWLQHLPKKPHAAFVPDHKKVKFDGQLIKDTYKWLAQHGNQFIYIYGEIDTWSATKVPFSDKVDALWMVMEDKHHGTARVKNMTDQNKEKVLNALEKWLK